MGGADRAGAGRDVERHAARTVRLAHLPLARLHRERVPVAGFSAAGARDRPEDARDPRHVQHAERARPARHEGVPELRGRRLFLPRQAQPHLERHEDEPRARAAGVGRRHRITPVHDYDLTGGSPPTSGSPRRCPTSAAGSGSSRRRAARSGSSTRARSASATSGSATRSRTRSRWTGAGSTSSTTRGCTASGRGAAAGRASSGRRSTATPGIVKPGQVDAGSGTTPTIMKGGYVAITDNADPMNVVVYRKAVRLKRGRRRKVCQVPVFDQGWSATENSLLTNNRSLYVENNYGYQDPFGPNSGAVTAPGFARVDIGRGGPAAARCGRRMTERGPAWCRSCPRRPGLIYTYTRDQSSIPGSQPLLLDRDQRHDGRDGLQGLRRQRPRLQQQLRRPGARPGRHRLPGHDGRDARAARRARSAAAVSADDRERDASRARPLPAGSNARTLAR